MTGYVEYDSNNSGGDWWLSDDDWKALEKAGWDVEWFANQDRKFSKPDSEGRWLGALASSAKRDGLTLSEAVAEWEKVTGACSTDTGCPCCGIPHNFTEYDSRGDYVASGPESGYSASW